MKRLPFPTAKALLASAATLSLGLLLSPSAQATDYVFTGTGEWYATPTNTNWTPQPTPGLTSGTLNVAGNTATINGAVDYNSGAAGGDFLLGNGDTMTISGNASSWTQLTGNYVKIGAGGGSTVTSTVDVTNGGFFNVLASTQLRIGQDGGAGNLVVDSTGGGLNIAGTNNGTAYSTQLVVATGSQVSLLGGSNSLGEINSLGTVTFGGGTTTTTQWDNAAAVYNLTGGTVTATNYDMNTAGATFNASGGSVKFTGNFTNLRAVTISGASISVAGTLNTNASTNVSMTAGSLTSSGNGTVNLNSAATFTLSGTAQFNMTGSGEFQPGYTFTAGQASNQSISGNASISVAGLVAFQGGATQKFDVNGGSITIGASSYNGIFSNGAYFNFTPSSSGVIYLPNVSVANAIADINSGKIRYNDTQYSTTTYGSEFTVIADPSSPTGSEIELNSNVTSVPEPATWLGGGLLVGATGWRRRRSLGGVLRQLLGTLY